MTIIRYIYKIFEFCILTSKSILQVFGLDLTRGETACSSLVERSRTNVTYRGSPRDFVLSSLDWLSALTNNLRTLRKLADRESPGRTVNKNVCCVHLPPWLYGDTYALGLNVCPGVVVIVPRKVDEHIFCDCAVTIINVWNWDFRWHNFLFHQRPLSANGRMDDSIFCSHIIITVNVWDGKHVPIKWGIEI